MLDLNYYKNMIQITQTKGLLTLILFLKMKSNLKFVVIVKIHNALNCIAYALKMKLFVKGAIVKVVKIQRTMKLDAMLFK